MQETTNPLENAVAGAVAAIMAPALEPRAVVAESLRRTVAAAHVHPAKREQAAAMVADFERAAIEALRRPDYAAAQAALEKFDRAFRYAGLSMAPIEPLQRDLWAPRMVQLGWGAFDIDSLFSRYLKPGEKISAVTWEGATIGDRVVSRRQMRLNIRYPDSTLGDDQWVSRFGPIRRVVRRENGDEVFED